MRLNEIVYTDARPVDGYGPGFFRIGGTAHEAPLVILPTGIFPWAGTTDPEPILGAAAEIDVVFIGTGPQIAPVPTAFRSVLEEAGVGVEIMASPAACRTYNVLLAEGRRIGLALLPV